MAGNGFKEIRMVRVKDLIRNPDYQRKLNERRAKAIAAKFNPEIFDPITVVERPGGKWAVVDGVTRSYAAELAGYEEVPATVSAARGQQEEAVLYSDKNGAQKPLTAIERYIADVFARRPDAVAIQAMLDEVDWTVNRQARGIDAIRKAYGKWGSHVTGRALRILAEVFKGRSRVPSRLIVGTITFIATHGDNVRDQRLLSALRKHEVGIERDLDARGEQGSASRPVVAAAVICGFYNMGLRSRHVHADKCPTCMMRDLVGMETEVEVE